MRNMATILLIVIYTAFIGLGIPDSLFGTAWPAIYGEFQIPVSWSNFVTLTISGGTIIASLSAARLINRFGTGRITAVSTVMTAAALLGFSLSGNIFWMVLCAIPLGFGAGTVDSALNNYVALHYEARHMNFLHCFYGIGVSLSPLVMSLALSGATWREGYRTVFWFQGAIALILILTLPLWKKAGHTAGTEETEPVRTLRIREMLKIPKLRKAAMIFFGSCALEYTCGTWGSTYLVESGSFTADGAARVITLYYAGMALGRFLSGVMSDRFGSWKILTMGMIVLFAALALLYIPAVAWLSYIAFFLIGLGNGPVFPNMVHLTPENFGREISQSVMGLQMAVSYLGIMLAPALFGVLAQGIGISFFPYYLLLLYLLMTGGRLLMQASDKKDRR